MVSILPVNVDKARTAIIWPAQTIFAALYEIIFSQIQTPDYHQRFHHRAPDHIRIRSEILLHEYYLAADLVVPRTQRLQVTSLPVHIFPETGWRYNNIHSFFR